MLTPTEMNNIRRVRHLSLFGCLGFGILNRIAGEDELIRIITDAIGEVLDTVEGKPQVPDHLRQLRMKLGLR